jgi:hypothetical protein
MTREEKRLNKAIDYSEIEENFLEYDDCGDVCNDKDFVEKAFIEGAKWAEMMLIEKASRWLIEGGYFVNNTETIDDFKRAMEE